MDKNEDLVREQKALKILERILDVESTDRGPKIESICGGDSALQERVERLLAFEAKELGSYADLPPVSAFMRDAEKGPDPGTRIGGFRLVRFLARGGMGWVYEAEQDQPRRRVALKLLQGGLERKDTRERFRYESQVLANLRHPGIAQVYDAGTHREDAPEGVRELPYFALEYVEDGHSITEFCSQNNLELDEILGLFSRVCAAVHYAHQKGVIHRDLKPDNILVTPAGNPKVIDFGVARVVDADWEGKRDQTQAGQLIGTIGYMSPEQLTGDLESPDTRTDVYSLGIVLFELLLGQLPFDLGGRSLASAIQYVQNTALRSPRQIDPTIDADLEAILLRATERAPERRYASASAFAEDLSRFQQHESVVARIPGRLHAARLFVRRNRTLVGMACGSLLALLAALFISVAEYSHAEHARLLAERAQAGESRERQTAQRRAAELGELARELQEEQRQALLHTQEIERQRARADSLLGDVHGFATELVFDINKKMRRIPGSLEARKLILSIGVEYLNKVALEVEDDPELWGQLVGAYLRLGDILGDPDLGNLNQVSQAGDCYARALDISNQQIEFDPGNLDLVYVHCQALLKRALFSRYSNDLEQAQGDLELALEWGHDLDIESPREGTYQYLLFLISNNAGQVARSRGMLDTASRLYDECEEHLNRAAKWLPQVEWERFYIPVERAIVFEMQDRKGEAIAERRRAIQLADLSLESGQARDVLPTAREVERLNLSRNLADTGELEEAFGELEIVLEHFEGLIEEFPENAIFQKTWNSAWHAQAEFLLQAGEPEGAIEVLDEVLDSSRAFVKAQPLDDRRKIQLARILLTAARAQDALQHQQLSEAALREGSTIVKGLLQNSPTSITLQQLEKRLLRLGTPSKNKEPEQ